MTTDLTEPTFSRKEVEEALATIRQAIKDGIVSKEEYPYYTGLRNQPGGPSPSGSQSASRVAERGEGGEGQPPSSGITDMPAPGGEDRPLPFPSRSPLPASRSTAVPPLLSRAEPQVMRLACLHALLDLSDVVPLPHLQAALHIWDHCAATVRTLFTEEPPPSLADQLLTALRAAPGGLTRSQLSARVGRNRKAQDIEDALGYLSFHGLAEMHKVKSPGPKPTECWSAIR